MSAVFVLRVIFASSPEGLAWVPESIAERLEKPKALEGVSR